MSRKVPQNLAAFLIDGDGEREGVGKVRRYSLRRRPLFSRIAKLDEEPRRHLAEDNAVFFEAFV